jgi:hypothetical protein
VRSAWWAAKFVAGVLFFAALTTAIAVASVATNY